jgi:nickel/cobalt transporter (NicO) family protein
MNFSPELLLIASVGVVGVLHTIVPDRWVPIALLRQRGWSSGETARAALTAGIGHVASTLIIASVVWFAGVAVAANFGHFIDTAASVALIGFGGWIAVSSWRE